MENNINTALEKKLKPLIIGLSIFIPVAVAALFQIEIKGVDFSFLPPIYSSINAIVAVLLVIAVIHIKKGNKEKHRLFIRLAILGSILFLIGYILYHGSSGEVKYGDTDHSGGDLSLEEKSALGIDEESGELYPKTDTHPDFNYERYQEMCGKQIKETRKCRTIDYDGHARHLISSDGTIYNCHHLLYKEKHPIGHIDNGWPENILDPIVCGEYGHCNPCDFRDMVVLPID